MMHNLWRSFSSSILNDPKMVQELKIVHCGWLFKYIELPLKYRAIENESICNGTCSIVIYISISKYTLFVYNDWLQIENRWTPLTRCQQSKRHFFNYPPMPPHAIRFSFIYVHCNFNISFISYNVISQRLWHWMSCWYNIF